MPTLSAAPAVLPKPPTKTYVSKFTQLKLDGLMRVRVDQSLLPVLSRSVAVKPSPKAEAGRSADCSRTPVTCGAGLGLWLSGEAAAEPAIPSESAVAVAMTAIALSFTLSSQDAVRLARPSGEQPRGAMTIVEAEPSAP